MRGASAVHTVLCCYQRFGSFSCRAAEHDKKSKITQQRKLAELLHVLPSAASCRRPADRGDTARLFTDPALNVRLQNAGTQPAPLCLSSTAYPHIVPIRPTCPRNLVSLKCVPRRAGFAADRDWFWLISRFWSHGDAGVGGAAHAKPKFRVQSAFYATKGVAPYQKNCIPLRLDTPHATGPWPVPATGPDPKKSVEPRSHNRQPHA